MSTKATVRVLMEIDVPDSWGSDCPVGQVHKQAIDAARGILRRYFSIGDGLKVAGTPDQKHEIRILSTVPVAVIVEETKS